MNQRKPDDDAHASTRRLVDLIQVLALDRPAVLPIIEGVVREVVAKDWRRRIADRLERLDVKSLEALDRLIGVFEGTRTDDSPSEDTLPPFR